MSKTRFKIKGDCIVCKQRRVNWIVETIPKDYNEKVCGECQTSLVFDIEEFEV